MVLSSICMAAGKRKNYAQTAIQILSHSTPAGNGIGILTCTGCCWCGNESRQMKVSRYNRAASTLLRNSRLVKFPIVAKCMVFLSPKGRITVRKSTRRSPPCGRSTMIQAQAMKLTIKRPIYRSSAPSVLDVTKYSWTKRWRQWAIMSSIHSIDSIQSISNLGPLRLETAHLS